MRGIDGSMAVKRPSRPALLVLAGTIAATIGGSALLMRRHRPVAKGDNSIEPARMPGSAADIHVGTGLLGQRP
ncbi:hypothetical protein ACFSC3_14470 [Sphingomonas floccifaciens]|uniref:Uncharacterized protein n=1 Tax=Sphingomonas floccifaciens TaxID=1844115 RepID=A0ABW4NFH1_9SPHN